MNQLIAITGQTATGKTSRALKLAQKNNGCLISADSRQVYKELNIITGKDIPFNAAFTQVDTYTLHDTSIDIGYYTLNSIRVYGYDFIHPNIRFSTYDYVRTTRFILSNTIFRDMIPIIVGGTHLYIQRLLDGIDATAEPDWDLRESLSDLSVEELQDMLKKYDSKTFNRLNNSDKNNPHRLIRKIEIARAGKSDTESIPGLLETHDLDLYKGFHYASDDDLQKAIQARVEKRMTLGALDEVRNLLEKYSSDDPGLQTLGYSELIQHLNGQTSLDEALDLWTLHEAQYAKRQMTFMKKDKRIEWKAV